MGYLTRLLVCLSMLGTAACVPDAVTGPAPAAPAPEAAAQSASDAGVADEAAPAVKSGLRSILLRGSQSMRADGGREPLYIVDGVIMCGTDWLDELRTEDIESIEVVKGTAAAGFDGSRARNGVISITTRRPDR